MRVAVIAVWLGVCWGSVMRAVRAHGAPLIDDLRRLAGGGHNRGDETAFLASGRGQHTQ